MAVEKYGGGTRDGEGRIVVDKSDVREGLEAALTKAATEGGSVQDRSKSAAIRNSLDRQSSVEDAGQLSRGTVAPPSSASTGVPEQERMANILDDATVEWRPHRSAQAEHPDESRWVNLTEREQVKIAALLRSQPTPEPEPPGSEEPDDGD